jgi:hypothetical protein
LYAVIRKYILSFFVAIPRVGERFFTISGWQRNLSMRLREAYQQKAEAQLFEWKGWIERVKEGADGGAGRHFERQRIVERLEDNYRIARVRLEELRLSREERWEFAKQAVERAMIDLKRALDESGVGEKAGVAPLQINRSHVREPYLHRKG